MPTIHFQPAALQVDLPAGTDLLAASRRAGVPLEAPCGGKGTCGRCLVRVASGTCDCDSLGTIPAELVAEGYRLACRTRVRDTTVTVELGASEEGEHGKFADSGADRLLVRQERFPREWEYDPLALKWLLQVEAPALMDGRGDRERLVAAIQADWGPQEVQLPLAVLRELPAVVRQQDGQVTATLVREAGRLVVVRLEVGDTTTRHHGLAIDIGTTTVAVQLVDLHLGRPLATATAYNRQVACGLDVISRINYAKRAGGLAELRQAVLDSIIPLIGEVAAQEGVRPDEITNAVISANTTMTHLLLGIAPEHLRLEPYTPAAMEVPPLVAQEVGLPINPASPVVISPAVGSYVGGDITAGLLCTDLAAPSGQAVSLFLDIGTNGELVVGNQDFLLGCACSAGPAFEGGGIGCGMRASFGAIERVSVDARSGKPTISTVGDKLPVGICGSGMIALMAELFRTGLIDPSGHFDRSRASAHLVCEGRQARYVLASAAESGNGRVLAIDERDLENILRAKAAIYSAMALLLQQVGLDFPDLASLAIAGGFGRYLDIEGAITIGMLPDLPRQRFCYLGNTALTGSAMILVSNEFRERQRTLARRITYQDITTDPTYMDQYMAALFLPHTEARRFPSVRVR